jgi:hypothetical protein
MKHAFKPQRAMQHVVAVDQGTSGCNTQDLKVRQPQLVGCRRVRRMLTCMRCLKSVSESASAAASSEPSHSSRARRAAASEMSSCTSCRCATYAKAKQLCQWLTGALPCADLAAACRHRLYNIGSSGLERLQDVEVSGCALCVQLVVKHLASKVLFLEGRKHALLVRDACRDDGLLLRGELPGLELLGIDPAEVAASVAD